MRYIELEVPLDPELVTELVTTALATRGYRVEWEQPGSRSPSAGAC